MALEVYHCFVRKHGSARPIIGRDLKAENSFLNYDKVIKLRPSRTIAAAHQPDSSKRLVTWSPGALVPCP